MMLIQGLPSFPMNTGMITRRAGMSRENGAGGTLVHRPIIKGSDLNHHNDPIPERWFMPDLVW